MKLILAITSLILSFAAAHEANWYQTDSIHEALENPGTVPAVNAPTVDKSVRSESERQPAGAGLSIDGMEGRSGKV